MPSLAEGFGLPVLESAACGTPALASADHRPGRGGGHSPRHLRPRRHRCVVPGHRRPALRRRAPGRGAWQPNGPWRRAPHGTPWPSERPRPSTAMDERRPASAWDRPQPPRRVALVGPLPPLVGGIAVYNDRLLRAVDGDASVRRGDARCSVPPPLPVGVGHFPIDTFGVDARPASYDAVVYTLGNSDGHLATVETALRYPGMDLAARSAAGGHRRHRARVARRCRLLPLAGVAPRTCLPGARPAPSARCAPAARSATS